MNIEKAIGVLKRHNIWRRGADIEMTSPKKLGEAIDTIVNHYEKSKEERTDTKSNGHAP